MVTNPERIRRWFLPVSGDLSEGGHYQLESNAGGTISHCEKPRGFAATWEYDEDVSWIEVRLTPEGDGRTRLELEHVAHVADESGTSSGRAPPAWAGTRRSTAWPGTWPIRRPRLLRPTRWPG